MNEALTWGALVLSSGAIVALFKFWMDIGKAWERMDQATDARTILSTKLDMLVAQLSDFRIEAARTYATNKSLSETEVTLAAGLRDSVQGVYSRLDAMTTRLDSLVHLATKGPHQ